MDTNMERNMNTKGEAPHTLSRSEAWPALPLEDWQETYHNLHRWTQIVGKVRLELTPNTNHWWNVPLYVNARGLTTSPIPYGDLVFEIEFDFITHELLIDRSDGVRRKLALVPRTVAEFYSEFMSALRSMGIELSIYAKPVEVATRSPLRKTTCIVLTTGMRRIASGASWSPAMRCSSSFVPASWGRIARCSFSGEALIWRLADFPDGALRSGPVPIRSRAKPTPTRSLARVGGPGDRA